jgi:hypothetical protein
LYGSLFWQTIKRSVTEADPVQHNHMYKIWRSAAMCLFGAIGLAAVTLVCFRLQLNLATAALLYLMVIVLLSLKGSFGQWAWPQPHAGAVKTREGNPVH